MLGASATSLLRSLFRQLPISGGEAITRPTPNRYLPWHVKPQDGKFLVVSASHKVVCLVFEEDDANSMAHEHNLRVKAREEWYGC